MTAGAPYGNTNAEKYDLNTSIEIFNKAIDLTNEREIVKVMGNEVNGYKYDFIGEIAGELNTFKQLFEHLTKRFSKELQLLNNQFHTNIERNCYYNGKKGAIKEASSIMNLKSNHKWTDRRDHSSEDGTMTPNKELTPEQKIELIDEIKKGVDELNEY